MNNKSENTFTCLIVEDEPLSQEIIESYIENCPDLKVLGVCKDALQANQILYKEKIDLLFLDINMPILNGIDWLKSLDELPEVIFTTAYPEHAVEGFNLNAVDYLLKPFSFNRFLKAVNKFTGLKKKLAKGNVSSDSTITVKSNKKTYLLKSADVNYIESDGDYLKLHRDEDCIVIHETLKSFQTKLPDTDFLRVHRSFIINTAKIDYLEGNQVCINQKMIPVANTYREKLKEILEKNR